MPHALAGVASKMLDCDIGLGSAADMAQCLQFQLHDWIIAEPIRRCQWGKRTKCANARASILVDGQQQQFQFRRPFPFVQSPWRQYQSFH